MGMKIVHFADAHIGVTTHGRIDAESGQNDRVLDFLDAFDEIIAYVQAEPIDLVLFAGDMFHRSNPSPALISEVTLRVMDIAKVCPFIIIPGNHDQALNRVSALEYLSLIDAPNVYVSDDPTYYNINGVFIGAYPYPTHRTTYRSNAAYSANLAQISTIYDQCQKWLDTAEATAAKARILLFHGTVEGARWGSYSGTAMSDESHMFDEIAAGWDYVALGHIHLHQCIGDNMVYSGSIERVDFGEADEDKGFIVIDVSDYGRVEWEFVKLPARPMANIVINLRGVPEAYHRRRVISVLRRADIDNNTLVKVRVMVDMLSASILPDYIYNLLSKAYRVVDVIIEPERVESTRIRDLDINPDDMTKDGLLLAYLRDRGVDDVTPLMDLFRDIIKEVDDE